MNENGIMESSFFHDVDVSNKRVLVVESSSSLREKYAASGSSSCDDETGSDGEQHRHHHHHHPATIHPFEWLTSLESLDDLLLLALETSTNSNSDTIATQSSSSSAARALERARAARVLDVGCGSSMLGEYLLEHPTLSRFVSQVVNVDKDPATLLAMQERWQQKTKKLRNINITDNRHDDDVDLEDRLLFLPPIDFVEQSIDCPPPPIPLVSAESESYNNYNLFDLIVDKSTLDCAMCTDHAAAALLCQVYRLLRRDHGVYLVISFHHVDFLQPLLQDCPGTDWDLSFHVIHREVEKDHDGIRTDATTITPSVLPPQESDSCLLHQNGAINASSSSSSSAAAWSSGCFHPNESYRRTVNAVLCRRRDSKGKSEAETAACNSNIDRDAVYRHINETIEQWYRFQNPLLTEARRRDLEQTFVSSSCRQVDDADDEKNNDTRQELDLPCAFAVLFTPAEREHLTYEYFLEDWHAFHDQRPELPADTLSYETAVAFLQEMQ